MEELADALSGETIDEYYANVIEMMSEITYDGVHKSVLGFKENADYPDVFTMEDGTKVNTDDKWSLRHDEIQDLYEFYMYGKLPKAEETGLEKSFSQSGSNYVITVSRPGIDAASFSFKVYMPEGEAPEGGWPYIIRNLDLTSHMHMRLSTTALTATLLPMTAITTVYSTRCIPSARAISTPQE